VHLVGFIIRINIFIQLGEGNCSNIDVKRLFKYCPLNLTRALCSTGANDVRSLN